MRKLTMTENMTPIDKKLIEKGMTRSDLSKQSGVPLRTIESWCRRLRVPVAQAGKGSRLPDRGPDRAGGRREEARGIRKPPASLPGAFSLFRSQTLRF